MIVFYKRVLSIPPYSLLAKTNDSLHFFDHLNNLIVAYDLDGNYLKETPINYHNNKGWGKEIIVNEEKTRCFAKFTRNGETSLVEINPDNGQTLGRYVLEVHAFPTKIRDAAMRFFICARIILKEKTNIFCGNRRWSERSYF